MLININFKDLYLNPLILIFSIIFSIFTIFIILIPFKVIINLSQLP